jgi:hypothetical protein
LVIASGECELQPVANSSGGWSDGDVDNLEQRDIQRLRTAARHVVGVLGLSEAQRLFQSSESAQPAPMLPDE